jgi:hypothetical protein
MATNEVQRVACDTYQTGHLTCCLAPTIIETLALAIMYFPKNTLFSHFCPRPRFSSTAVSKLHCHTLLMYQISFVRKNIFNSNEIKWSDVHPLLIFHPHHSLFFCSFKVV